MANRIINETVEFDLDAALVATESGDTAELAIAAWWANSIPVEAPVSLEVDSDEAAHKLLLSGLAHAVSYKSDAKLFINGAEAKFSELLEPAVPKPPNADWFVYDDETRKTRLVPHLEDPRTTSPPYDLQSNKYSWLWNLTPFYAQRQALMIDFDTSLWQAIDNAHLHSGMSQNETGLAVVSAKDESSRDAVAWQGQVTVIWV